MFRHFAFLLATLGLLAVAVLAYPYAAQAQVTPNTSIDLDPFIAEVMPYLLALFGAVITAAVAWTTKKLNDWTGINIEAKHREALQSALLNGARAIMVKYTPQGMKIDIANAPIREGVEFVLSSVPDAVKYFGLTPDEIEKHLMPKLGSLVGVK